MQFSLDQRLYNLNMSKKELCEECNYRGRKISYGTVCRVIEHPGEVLYKYEKIVVDTVSELEAIRGITDIEF